MCVVITLFFKQITMSHHPLTYITQISCYSRKLCVEVNKNHNVTVMFIVDRFCVYEFKLSSMFRSHNPDCTLQNCDVMGQLDYSQCTCYNLQYFIALGCINMENNDE